MRKIVFLFLVLFGACSDDNNSQPAVTEVSHVAANVIPSAEVIDTGSVPVPAKTDAEVVVDGILNAIGDAVENKRKRDSIFEANKDKHFAYKIGFEKTDRNDVFDTYKKLIELKIPGLYALETGRKEYVVISYEAKPEATLREQLEAFKSQVSSVEPHVELVNIMSFCSLKEIIKKDKNLTSRKEDVEIPCLVCDK